MELEKRFMRILVFFDLPVRTIENRKVATQFRNFLLRDGYFMLQFSVYSRICKGMDTVAKHISRLKIFAPDKGNIRVITVTEKQFASMELIVGTESKQEIIGATQILLL